MKRSLSQNFLHQKHFQEHITQYALEKIKPDSHIFEIGPGRGALTDYFKGKVKKLTVIEKDDSLVKHWQTQVPSFGASGTELTVVHEDFLLWDGHLEVADIFVGNLPFNVATPIYTKILKQARNGAHLVLMFQKEVGQRIIAREGKEYGSLSIYAQLHGDTRKVVEVPPSAFVPKPAVAGWVLHQELWRYKDWRSAQLELCEQVLAVAFQQRRKQLLKRLVHHWPKMAQFWEYKKWSPALRAEELKLAQWGELLIYHIDCHRPHQPN